MDSVPIATRSGQVVLGQLTDLGRSLCLSAGLDPGPVAVESLEHRYWVRKTDQYFTGKGFDVVREYSVGGNGAVDLLASRPGEKVAIEIETGRSDIHANLAKMRGAGFDRTVVVATSPSAAAACRRAVDATSGGDPPTVEVLTWLDIS